MKHAAISIAILLLCSCGQQIAPPRPPQPAPAPDRTVFGIIKLGEPLPSLPQCDDPVPMEPCDQSSLFADDPGRIYIPALQATGTYSMVIEFQEIENKVERVWVNSTKRLGADREMLADLKAKYGKASSNGRSSATQADIAIWELEGLEVLWSSRDLSSDHGTVLIQTERGSEYAAEQRRQVDAATPRL